MNDDFIIRFIAEIGPALDAVRALTSAVLQAEKTMNSALSNLGKSAGVGGLKRVETQSVGMFNGMIARTADFEERLNKMFRPSGVTQFKRDLNSVDSILGKIENAQVAKSPVSEALLRPAIRTLTNLRTALTGDAYATHELTKQLNALQAVRVKQAKPEIDRLLNTAQEAAVRGDLRLQVNSLSSAERVLQRLKAGGADVNKQLKEVQDNLTRLNSPRPTTKSLDLVRGARPQLVALLNQARGAAVLGDTTKEESALRRYQQRLAELSVQGVTTSRSMAQVKQRLDEIARAKLPSAQQAFLQAGGDKLPGIQSKINLARQNGDVRGQIRGLQQLEQQLNKLNDAGYNMGRAMAAARSGIVSLTGAAANNRAIAGLEINIRNVMRRIEEIQRAGNQPRRSLVENGLNSALQQQQRGYALAAQSVQHFKQILDTLPPSYGREIDSLRRERDALLQSIRAREALNQKPTGGQLGRGFEINRQLSTLAAGTPLGNAATNDMNRFDAAIKANRLSLDQWTNSFRNHALRITEGLVLYNALGQTMETVASTVRLVANTDQQLARFQAVVGDLPDEELKQFTDNLADISVQTNTPFPDLTGSIDVVASGIKGLSGDVLGNVEAFSKLAGQLSNVIGLNGQQEEVTRDLVAIFKVMRSIDPNASVDSLRLLLDQFTVAGNNSQDVIRGIVQGIREIGPNAKAAGVDLNFLAFLIGDLVQSTGQGGTEIGGLLRTTLAKLSDPDVIQKAFFEAGEGIIKVTEKAEDGSTKLLNAQQILVNFFHAVESGAVDQETAKRILEVLNPPLNPAAIGLNTFLFDALGDSVKRLGTEAPGAAGSLNDLNDLIINTIGGRFEQIINRMQRLIINMLGPLNFGLGVILGVLDTFVSLLEAPVIGGLVGAAGAALTFAGALALLATAFGKLKIFGGAIFGTIIGQITGARNAMVGLGTATAETTTLSKGLVNAQGQQIGTVIPTIDRMATAWRQVGSAIRGALKAALVFLALDVAAQLPDKIGDITNSINGGRDEIISRSRINPDDLRRGLDSAESFDVFGSKQVNTFASFLGSGLNDKQRQNVINLTEAMTQLRRENKLTAEAQAAMEGMILQTNGRIKDQVVSSSDLLVALEMTNGEMATGTDLSGKYLGNMGELPGSIDDVTAAEKRAAEAISLSNQLSGERAEAITELVEQLNSGAIDADEFATGQDNINKASEAAAQFLSAYAGQLSLIPGLQEEMARTGKDAGGALISLLTANPDTIDQQIEIINRMVEIADTNAAIAEEVAANPITPRVNTERIHLEGIAVRRESDDMIKNAETVNAAWILANRGIVPMRPRIDNKTFQNDAHKFLSIAQAVVVGAGLAAAAMVSVGKIGTRMEKNTGAGSDLGGSTAELEALRAAIAALQGAEASGRTGDAAKEPSQTGILDLGDLPASTINEIVRLATTAQNKVIAAGGTVDTTDTTAIFKDAAFQQLIKGIDQTFLQQALEELTEVEKKRLQLEQEQLQGVTRELQTRVGPIQSLVSSPVLSAGGGVLSGQGLNADPTMGNFTINVPINWSGMSLTQLQAFIYQSIQQAWIDAGRGG